MLMSLFETTETLTSLAKEKIPGDLGADDIFPLWLYTTIHINMVKLHSHLCFMENFCSPEEGMTQLGYCLTTFQGLFFLFSNCNNFRY